MLKAKVKNNKVKLRGKKVSHTEIVDLMVELIDVDYNGFGIKYSKLMEDIRKAYTKRLVKVAKKQVQK